MPSRPNDSPGNAIDRVRLTYRYLTGKKAADEAGIDNKTLNRRLRDTLVSITDRQETLASLKLSAELGLAVGHLSEASRRLPQNKFLITANRTWFRQPSEEDLVVVMEKAGTGFFEDRLPTHWAWHQAIYKHYQDTQAILLAQPTALMALAGHGSLPNAKLLRAANANIGSVTLCPPETDAILEHARQADVLMVPGIGGLAQAESIEQAIIKLQTVDRWCDISLHAK